MPIDESLVFRPVRVAVLTVSDSRSIDEDTSGEILATRVVAAGHELGDRRTCFRGHLDQVEILLLGHAKCLGDGDDADLFSGRPDKTNFWNANPVVDAWLDAD